MWIEKDLGAFSPKQMFSLNHSHEVLGMYAEEDTKGLQKSQVVDAFKER